MGQASGTLFPWPHIGVAWPHGTRHGDTCGDRRGFRRWTRARSLRLPPAPLPSSQRGTCVPHGAASATVRRANMTERGAALCANAEQTQLGSSRKKHLRPSPMVCSSLCSPLHALLDDKARRLVDNNLVYEEARPGRVQQVTSWKVVMTNVTRCLVPASPRSFSQCGAMRWARTAPPA